MKKALINKTRYANSQSNFLGCYVAILAPAIVTLIIGLVLMPIVIPFSLTAIAVEVCRAVTKKTYKIWWSTLMRSLFSSSYSSYPTSYKASIKDILPCVIASFLLTISVPNTAKADYQLVDSGSYDRAILEGSLGTTPADVVAGSCEYCQLDMALEMLIPKGFLLSWADNINKKQIVHFKGPKQWAYILKEIAIENDIVFILRSQDSMGRNSLSISRAPVNGGALIYETPKKPTLLMQASKKWVLEPGQQLDLALKEWAAREGKYVAWELDRYPIVEYKISFNGSLLDALEGVIAAYQAQGLMPEAQIVPQMDVFVITSSKRGDH